jgi:antitoxin MazE
MVSNKTRIVRIGNSQGVRIPRNLLEQAGFITNEGDSTFGQEVELEAGHEGILIRRTRRTRAGWAEQFQQMAARGEDALLDPPSPPTTWDEREWLW